MEKQRKQFIRKCMLSFKVCLIEIGKNSNWNPGRNWLQNFVSRAILSLSIGCHNTIPKVPVISARLMPHSYVIFGQKHLWDLHRLGVDVFRQRLNFLLLNVPNEPISRKETQMRAAVQCRTYSFIKSQSH